jgi:acyl-CoA synthetase (AMP-forming)/AMP-acid ligase II
MAGDEAPWVEGLTIGVALRRTAQRYPDLDAFVFPELEASEQPLPANLPPAERRRRALRISYRSLDSAVDRVAKGLLRRESAKGTTSRSGPRTGPTGCCCSLPPPGSAR